MHLKQFTVTQLAASWCWVSVGLDRKKEEEMWRDDIENRILFYYIKLRHKQFKVLYSINLWAA